MFAARVTDPCIPHCTPFVIAPPGSLNVFINGLPAARLTDKVTPHTMPNPAKPPTPPCIPHLGVVIIKGSATVFINGLPAARMGDTVGPMCTAIQRGSLNVWIGG